MDKNFFDHKSHVILVFGLIVWAYFMLMFGNGIVSLTHPDEVFYIQTAKEMLSHNSWLTPIIFDQPQFEKPILSYVLFAAAIKFFGLNPFAARFWPAMFGIIGVGIVYWISWMLFKRKRLSVFSGLILGSSFIYLALSRAVLTDMIFSILVTITIGFFSLAYFIKEERNKGIVLAFFFMALSVLAKGILGIVFPLLAVLIFTIYKKDFSFWKNPVFIPAIFLFLLISVPWHWLMYQQYGQAFISEYFYNDHIRRILEAEHAKSDTWYFYLTMIVAGMMPWSLFGLSASRAWMKEISSKGKHADRLVFLLIWILSVFGVVEVAHSKLASYVFPVFPAIAILLAYYMDQFLDSVKKSELRIPSMILAGLLMLAVVGGITVAAPKYIAYITNMTVLYVSGGILFFSGLIIFVLAKLKKDFWMLIAHSGITFALLISVFLGRSMAEPWVSCKEICDVFKKVDQSQTTVLTSKFYVRGIRYYTDRPMAVININGKGFFSAHPIPFLNTDDMVRDFLNGQDVTYAVVRKNDLQDLFRITENRPLKIHQIDVIGGKYLIKIEKI